MCRHAPLPARPQGRACDFLSASESTNPDKGRKRNGALGTCAAAGCVGVSACLEVRTCRGQKGRSKEVERPSIVIERERRFEG